MNQVYNHITLASGQVLSKGQIIRLGNKIAQMFPDLKGNILPLKDYSFCRADEFDFQHVQFQLEGEEFGMASKVVSLAEDEIEYFALENDTLYGYTTCFKIDMERALGTKEVIVLKEDNFPDITSSVKVLEVRDVIMGMIESMSVYGIGLITRVELDNQLLDILERFFRRRDKWELKDNPPGLIGGTAAAIIQSF